MEYHILKFFAFWHAYLHFMATLFLLTHLLQSALVANASSNETDRFALLKLKESIFSDPQWSLNSWNESVHFCEWQGVTCSTRHQRVTVLNLNQASLHGTISPYIGNLSFLRNFSLANNSFSGTIPLQVVQISRLRSLDLSHNKLKGGIPLNMSCPELTSMDFGYNNLTGIVPSEIGSLMKLKALKLSRNNLTGGIPRSLGNLSSLATLFLTVNNLGGNIPEELGQLRRLSFIAIGSNNLSGMIPPSLFNISSMTLFSFPVNNLEGSLPSGIGLKMPNLQTVELAENKFSGKIPASFSNASRLERLDLGTNNFIGQVPKSFGSLYYLNILSLAKNKLGTNSTDDLRVITSLTNCSNLYILALSQNNFGGVLPNSVGNLSIKLEQLFLGMNQIRGEIPRTLGNLESLILLTMEDNLFTGVLPSSLGKLKYLQILALNTNRLSGEIPSSLGNLTRLSQLHLFENKLEGSIQPTIGNCKSLQVMNISQNRLGGEIPIEIFGLSSLLFLDLSQNSLTGSLSFQVSKLDKIYHLDMSRNNLNGNITESIGECQNLEYFSLSENLFQGRIPSSLASLRGLQYLDLSQNNLSGEIPKELEGVTFLVYLNISSNDLEGEVPNGGVFRNTSGVSLEGNAKLCGGVSELQLPACAVNAPKKRNLKLKLLISVVVGCSFLFSLVLALYVRRKAQKKKPVSEVAPISSLSKVSYQTLHQATGGFSSSNRIGIGGFSSVYKGIIDEEDNVVAVKVLNLQQRGASRSFVAECNALRNIRHRNLVKIITCCSSTDHNGNDFKALLFEYMSNGSLEEWLHREDQSRSLNLVQRLNIAFDVASALCYLHDDCEPQIIHRDMKPSNVLLDDDMIAHVGDFGLARLIPMSVDNSENQSSTLGIKGTMGYVAPEYAIGVEPSTQGDVYSFGILVLQLFTGRRPTDEMFIDGCNIHTYVKINIQERLMETVDPTLIAALEHDAANSRASYGGARRRGANNDIETGENNIENQNSSVMESLVGRCILPTLKIGVACSEDSPRNRMSMEEVIRELHHVKKAFAAIGVDNRQQRPRRN